MKLFLDTNILIDVVANREPWVNEALVLLELANQHRVVLCAADYSFINIAYITRKSFTSAELSELMNDLQKYIQIVEVGEPIILKAIKEQWKDFEDSVQAFVAEREKVDYIITRNVKDFLSSSILAITPVEFLNRFL